LTVNNESWFRGGGNDERNLKEVNEDNTTPRDGQPQQLMIQHPRRGGPEGERLGMRRNGMLVRLKRFRVLSIRRETQRLKRGLHIIEIFSSPANATYMILIVTAMLMLDSKTLMPSAIQIPSSR
jgi:hypothetical protein